VFKLTAFKAIANLFVLEQFALEAAALCLHNATLKAALQVCVEVIHSAIGNSGKEMNPSTGLPTTRSTNVVMTAHDRLATVNSAEKLVLQLSMEQTCAIESQRLNWGVMCSHLEWLQHAMPPCGNASCRFGDKKNRVAWCEGSEKVASYCITCAKEAWRDGHKQACKCMGTILE
jgi:hypothetical protein